MRIRIAVREHDLRELRGRILFTRFIFIVASYETSYLKNED